MTTQLHITVTLGNNVTPLEAARIIADSIEQRFGWVTGVDLDAVTGDVGIAEVQS